MDNPDIQPIDDLAKDLPTMLAHIASHIIETQAMVNVLLDIERNRLVAEGRSESEVKEFLENSFQNNREKVRELSNNRLKASQK